LQTKAVQESKAKVPTQTTRTGRTVTKPKNTHLDADVPSLSEGTMEKILNEKIPVKVPDSMKPNFALVMQKARSTAKSNVSAFASKNLFALLSNLFDLTHYSENSNSYTQGFS